MVDPSVLLLFVVVLNGPTPARVIGRVLIKNSCIATPAGAGASRPVAAAAMEVAGAEEVLVVVVEEEGKAQTATTKIRREVASPAPVRMETAFKTARLLSPLQTRRTRSTGCRT